MNALTRGEAEAILAIEGGADVYDYLLASVLRGIQRRGLPVGQMQGAKHTWRTPRARLFDIADAQVYAGDGADRMPYFGAIATAAGVQAARDALVGIAEVQS